MRISTAGTALPRRRKRWIYLLGVWTSRPVPDTIQFWLFLAYLGVVLTAMIVRA